MPTTSLLPPEKGRDLKPMDVVFCQAHLCEQILNYLTDPRDILNFAKAHQNFCYSVTLARQQPSIIWSRCNCLVNINEFFGIDKLELFKEGNMVAFDGFNQIKQITKGPYYGGFYLGTKSNQLKESYHFMSHHFDIIKNASILVFNDTQIDLNLSMDLTKFTKLKVLITYCRSIPAIVFPATLEILIAKCSNQNRGPNRRSPSNHQEPPFEKECQCDMPLRIFRHEIHNSSKHNEMVVVYANDILALSPLYLPISPKSSLCNYFKQSQEEAQNYYMERVCHLRERQLNRNATILQIIEETQSN
uniref:DUF2263 domain-containing protein n=1 Tax=Rhabditophanes sp. KR3021 TaxID=114890 RepID=A0AC35TUB4_9BILA